MDIVVASCQKYSDAWNPFCTLFYKFWPTCPYRLFLITDKCDRAWGGDRAIVLDTDLYWSKNLQIGLQHLNSDHVLLLQEDFFINKQVDTEFINSALHIMQKDPSIACFRLMPCPGSDEPLTEDYGAIAQTAPYKISCQAAIWRREFLIHLLGMTLDPWHFELKGTEVVKNWTDKFLSVNRSKPDWPFQYYVTAIVKGKWQSDAVEFCKKLKIPIDLSRRLIDSPR